MNLPTSFDAEMQVVGAIVVDPSMFVPVSEVVAAEDFSFKSCRAVFDAVAELSKAGRDVDLPSVRRQLAGDQSAVERLIEAAGAVGFPRHAVSHAETVRDLAGLRRVAVVGQDLVNLATAEGTTFPDALETAERGVFGLTRNGHHAADWHEAMTQALDRLEFRHQTDNVVTGLPFGLRALDERTTGMQPGWLVIVGARPGEGKTSLALKVALHNAERGVPVLFVSREMSDV